MSYCGLFVHGRRECSGGSVFAARGDELFAVVPGTLLHPLVEAGRAVDLLVQVELTGEYEHSPIVTADNTLILLKKETGIV